MWRAAKLPREINIQYDVESICVVAIWLLFEVDYQIAKHRITKTRYFPVISMVAAAGLEPATNGL